MAKVTTTATPVLLTTEMSPKATNWNATLPATVLMNCGMSARENAAEQPVEPLNLNWQ